jgi:hypothetical protein
VVADIIKRLPIAAVEICDINVRYFGYSASFLGLSFCQGYLCRGILGQQLKHSQRTMLSQIYLTQLIIHVFGLDKQYSLLVEQFYPTCLL